MGTDQGKMSSPVGGREGETKGEDTRKGERGGEVPVVAVYTHTHTVLQNQNRCFVCKRLTAVQLGTG